MKTFEEMIKEVSASYKNNKEDNCETSHCETSRCEIVISYDLDKEEEAKIIKGNKDLDDVYAILWAVGKKMGEIFEMDGEKISKELVANIIKVIAKEAANNIFKDLEDLLKI